MWAEQTISNASYKHGKNEALTAVFGLKRVNSDSRQIWKAVAATPPTFTRDWIQIDANCQIK
jgi:hypothetical protein